MSAVEHREIYNIWTLVWCFYTIEPNQLFLSNTPNGKERKRMVQWIKIEKDKSHNLQSALDGMDREYWYLILMVTAVYFQPKTKIDAYYFSFSSMRIWMQPYAVHKILSGFESTVVLDFFFKLLLIKIFKWIWQTVVASSNAFTCGQCNWKSTYFLMKHYKRLLTFLLSRNRIAMELLVEHIAKRNVNAKRLNTNI